jgi:hypothetical protein
MNKIWLPFIFLVSILNSYGQVNNTAEEILRERFQKYCAAVPWEEIYIHSDRSEYIAGEDMWLKVYLFDRAKNRLSESNSIAYFELWNSDNSLIIKRKISLEKGLGPAHILLPDTLSTGRYIIRTYTNWMKNLLPANSFTQEVIIYNALNDKSGKIIQEDVNNTPFATNSLKSDHNKDTGVKMAIDNHNPDRLNIVLDSDETYRNGNNNNCILLIQTHGIINLIRKIKLGPRSVNIFLPKEVLLSGINQIVIFNEDLDPVCGKYIYTPLKGSAGISLNAIDNFKTREKVNLDVDFGEENIGVGNRSEISVSVTPAEGGIFKPDIDDYLVFGTEFGILPASIRNNHLSTVNTEVIDSFLVNASSKWINWETIMSGKFPVLKYEKEENYHFLKGRLINKNSRIAESGKYLFLSKPGKNATFQYSLTDSAGNFSFSLPVSENIMDLIIQPESADATSSIMISPSFSDEVFQWKANPDTISTEKAEYISRLGINYQVSKIYGISSTGGQLRPALPLPEPKRFYGKPDIELKMNDYIKLPLMEEVFFELTPGVLLKKKKNSYTMAIFDPVSNRQLEKPPVVFIDGVVISELNIVAAIDPETVEKIEVIKDMYLVGDYIFFGIVNIITRDGDYSNLTLPDNVVRMNYRVVDPVESFSSPAYQDEVSKKSRIPDFRNTLYWNPGVKSGDNNKASIEFWTSDGAGSFEICLQGVNSRGMPVSLRKTITVR